MINTNSPLPPLDIIGSSAVKASSPLRSALKTIFIIIAVPLAGLATIFACFVALDVYSRMKNMIRLSAEELKDFKEFIEKEKIDIENGVDANIMPLVGGKFAINSPKLFSAYVKYLVKNSTDHELKDVPSEDIVIFTKSSKYEKDLPFLLELAKESGKPIPGLSNSVVCRNLKSAFSLFPDVPPEELNQEVCLLEKSAIIDCIKTDASRKLGKDVEIFDMGDSAYSFEILSMIIQEMHPLKHKQYLFSEKEFIAIPADRVQEYNKIVSEFIESKKKIENK